MTPKVVTTSEFRKDIAHYINQTPENLVVIIKGKKTNKIVLDESEYNKISSLANQFLQEDPEGEYRKEFIKETLKTIKDNDIDEKVSSVKELL